jgi:hypothetical protein
MRALVIGALLLIVAPQLRAQDSLPGFAFNGHRIGETKAAGEPWSECMKLDGTTTICLREREQLDGISAKAGYVYMDGRLSAVHVSVDSVGFESVLAALTKRYGEPRTQHLGSGHAYAQWRFKEGRLQLTRTGSMIIAKFAAAR